MGPSLEQQKHRLNQSFVADERVGCSFYSLTAFALRQIEMLEIEMLEIW